MDHLQGIADLKIGGGRLRPGRSGPRALRAAGAAEGRPGLRRLGGAAGRGASPRRGARPARHASRPCRCRGASSWTKWRRTRRGAPRASSSGWSGKPMQCERRSRAGRGAIPGRPDRRRDSGRRPRPEVRIWRETRPASAGERDGAAPTDAAAALAEALIDRRSASLVAPTREVGLDEDEALKRQTGPAFSGWRSPLRGLHRSRCTARG